MNWVDLVVVLLAVIAAISGARHGLITTLPATVGVLGGTVIGLIVTPMIMQNFNSNVTRIAVWMGALVLLVALGETIGVWLGRSIRQHIRLGPFASVDYTLGALVQCAVVFVVAWVFALPLTSVPVPGLAAAIRGSVVLGTVNNLMPAQAEQLPNDVSKLLSTGLLTATGPFTRTPIAVVDPPDTALQNSQIVRAVQPSVLKVRGKAPSCSRALEGSGFVIGPERVMTNAHVVAGTDDTSVEVGRGQLTAHVVYYDPEIDVAVLSVPGLDATPLRFDQSQYTSGQDAIVLGYPLDGPYTARAARVRQRIELNGPDIYGSRKVTRDVFTVRSTVKSGNSGGPLIDPNGRVIGVVFGAAVDDPETGFALTAAQVANVVAGAPNMFRAVSTGSCAE
ncbi:MarP family serine protease [Kutzneria viridogrisea]|uniref:Serine protease n=2 Tax=Kutzneria TaxID=43356 RepID=W5VZJ6_9PSEU|nr:MarP family serine protease [Kutzneria albida]AHH93686.1 Colicin V production protein [Kutzneria albida DSM 43870]MBA8931310.1 S1-C subfamily serine protease [Kutzneria viridogrisea]